ncbi:unnamed protein product [Porites evermanni]|uniref:Uncharacterized protein n=1 Tax=Porites evermanni TaxID=104178 RepID=A0ABN8RA13_9CNID|nr:unnamed protein product [Porites evermanni]
MEPIEPYQNQKESQTLEELAQIEDIAVTYKPERNDNIHFLTDTLEVLFDGGAHHDFVNNDGKTPMDMARTDETRMILSERRKLELKCICAIAVKKLGIPYNYGLGTQNTREIR